MSQCGFNLSRRFQLYILSEHNNPYLMTTPNKKQKKVVMKVKIRLFAVLHFSLLN